jgi:ABC-type dipeptide/oligopeptide/nickel transport system permease component
MGRYIARRLLLTIPVLIGASFLIFAMVYALPGDPIRALGGDRPLAPAVVAQLREEFNLDDPLVIQYAKYVGDLLQGDFGTDFRGREVLDTIQQRLPVTMQLAAVAGLVLAAGSLAYVARLTRTSVAENLRADYVRTARAKGLPNRTVIIRHTLRNSLIPVVTFIGADIGTLMGGAIVTESVFNLPGIGRAIFDSVRQQEGAVVVGIVTLMVFVFIFFNLVVDVLYAVLDPRIRYD